MHDTTRDPPGGTRRPHPHEPKLDRGIDYNPCSASFVPAPPEHVEALLDDLCAFRNHDSLPAIAQAAIAHAQFETIHPFVDGNGRTGRALIHVVLRRRDLVHGGVPPVSLVLATWSRDYIGALAATRYPGSADSSAAHAGMSVRSTRTDRRVHPPGAPPRQPACRHEVLAIRSPGSTSACSQARVTHKASTVRRSLNCAERQISFDSSNRSMKAV